MNIDKSKALSQNVVVAASKFIPDIEGHHLSTFGVRFIYFIFQPNETKVEDTVFYNIKL